MGARCDVKIASSIIHLCQVAQYTSEAVHGNIWADVSSVDFRDAKDLCIREEKTEAYEQVGKGSCWF